MEEVHPQHNIIIIEMTLRIFGIILRIACVSCHETRCHPTLKKLKSQNLQLTGNLLRPGEKSSRKNPLDTLHEKLNGLVRLEEVSVPILSFVTALLLDVKSWS